MGRGGLCRVPCAEGGYGMPGPLMGLPVDPRYLLHHQPGNCGITLKSEAHPDRSGHRLWQELRRTPQVQPPTVGWGGRGDEGERSSREYVASLKMGIGITLAFFALEVAGGYYSGSLSLFADAGHMFIDASALLLSLAAIHAARSLPTRERTYGLHRAGIFAAFVNGLLLLVVSVWILYAAFTRLSHPQPVESTVMLAVAIAGLAANLYIAYRLSGRP